MDYKDFKIHWDKERADRLAKPRFERIILNFFDFMRYRFVVRITELPIKIKWSLQRLIKGYADCDVWGLNTFLIEKIRPPLKEFVKNYEEQGHSLPMDFATDPAGWLAVLKKIEYAFDYYWKDEFDTDSWNEVKTPEQIQEENKRIKEGFELWGRYCMDLWD